MDPIRSLIIALSMFTSIPMPSIEWKKENMRLIFCWFPIIGAILGLLEYLWYIAARHFSLGVFIYSSVAAVLPVLLTGGIHTDGFMDTCDALSSHGSKEKMQEILADPHTGAFAIIYTLVYFILYFGALTRLYEDSRGVLCLCCSYVFVRAMAVVFLMSTKFSKDEGLLYTLAEHNATVVTSILTVVWVMGSLSAMEYSYIVPALMAMVAVIIFMLAFKKVTLNKFGGVSGDLAGFFICVSELICLLAIALGGAVL